MESRPRYLRHPKKRKIKAEHIIPLVPALIIILIYLLLVVTELDSYISTKYEISGFELIRPVPSGITLDTDGNLKMKFINLWLARVTILNLTVINEESGRCFIPPGDQIIYKDKAYSLPFVIPPWEKFEIMAFDCAHRPDGRIITTNDKFRIKVTSRYIIGKVFGMESIDDAIKKLLLRGMTIHKEEGWIRGEYNIAYAEGYPQRR